MKNNIIQDKLRWVYLTGFAIILTLPILAWPPYFFPVDWGKSIVFRSVMAILLFLFIFQLLFKKSELKMPAIKKNLIFWLLTGLFGIYLLATIFSVDPLFSLWGSPYRGGGFVTFAFCIVFGVLAFFMLKKEDWKKAWIFSIFIGILVSFVAITQYNPALNHIFSAVLNAIFHKSILLVPSRPPSTMGNPDILAVYLLLLSFLTLSFGIKWQKLWEKILCFSALAIFIYTILITESRAAYLGIAIGAIYFLLFYPKKMMTVKIGVVALLIIVGTGIIYVNTTSQFPKFLQQNKLFNSVTSRLSLNLFLTDARFSTWAGIDYKILIAKPVLGYGPENFAVGFDKFYSPSVPNLQGANWWDKAHNIILQTGSDAGFLGIAAYLALFIILFWQLQKLKNPYKSEEISINQCPVIAHGIQATLIGYFTAIFFGFDTFSTYLLFFLLIAYSMHIIYNNRPNQEQNEIQKNTFWKSASICVLFIILVIFLWQYNLVPLQINAEINKAQILVDQKQCDQAFSKMDKVMPKHSLLDSYIRMEYVEFERTCAGFYPENNLAYTKKGVELLSEAVKIQPLYTRYWLFLGNLTTTLAEQETNSTTKNNLLKQANDYFDKALQLGPKHQEILSGKAKIEIDAGNYSDAQKYSEKCVLANTTFGDCYWYLALSEIYLKNTTDAAKNMQTAIYDGYNVNSETSLVELGNAYNSLADYKDLAIVFEKLTAVNPNAVQYHSSLAVIYAKLGQYDKARQEAATVLQLSPQSKQNVDAFIKTLP